MDFDSPGRLEKQLQIGRRERRHREEARSTGPVPRGGAIRAVLGFSPARARSPRRRRFHRRGHGRPRGRWIDRRGDGGAFADNPAESLEGIDPVTGSVRTVSFHQGLPQPALPVRSACALPRTNPVGAIEQALVVHSGESVGELEPLSAVPVAQIAAERTFQRVGGAIDAGRPGAPASGSASRSRPHRYPRRLRQQVVDAPAKPRRFVGLMPRKARIRGAHDRPREFGGQLEADIRCDAQLPRQFQREPPANGGVRHDDSLGRDRFSRIGAHPVCEPGRERLHAVGLMDLQSCHFTTVQVRSDGPSQSGRGAISAGSSRRVTGIRRRRVHGPDPRSDKSPRGSAPRLRRSSPTRRR